MHEMWRPGPDADVARCAPHYVEGALAHAGLNKVGVLRDADLDGHRRRALVDAVPLRIGLQSIGSADSAVADGCPRRAVLPQMWDWHKLTLNVSRPQEQRARSAGTRMGRMGARGPKVSAAVHR